MEPTQPLGSQEPPAQRMDIMRQPDAVVEAQTDLMEEDDRMEEDEAQGPPRTERSNAVQFTTEVRVGITSLSLTSFNAF